MIVNGIEITKGLIVDEPWISKILSGEKPWEMRSRKTKIRGWIGLIRKGSGQVVGIANLSTCYEPFTKNKLHSSKQHHCIDYQATPDLYKWNVPWVLVGAKPIEPKGYIHKRGAVIWVNL